MKLNVIVVIINRNKIWQKKSPNGNRENQLGKQKIVKQIKKVKKNKILKAIYHQFNWSYIFNHGKKYVA